MTARFLYLSQDRPDIQFGVRECSKRMSEPRVGDMVNLKRIARHLMGRPSCKALFPFGGDLSNIIVHTDSDWAGDRTARKSVSGGVLRWGP